MSYYRNSNFAKDDDIDVYHFNQESMLGHLPNPDLTNSVNNEVDLEYDQEVNDLLKDIIDEDLDPNTHEEELKDDDSIDPKKEQFQDYYDDFPEQKQEPVPQWYEEMLQKKIKETKNRLTKLSDYVCYASAITREQILRIERDHNSPFCKLDFPRHPPLSEPWQNYWRFNCVIKCKEDPDPPPYHAHTADCELLLLEHVGTGVTTRSKNILPCEFPKYVMDAVEQFQIFAKESSKVNMDYDDIPDTVFEKPTWQYIKIRSNFKGELMLIVCGKGITPALTDLKHFFNKGPGRTCNVVSLYCINIKWSQKKGIFPPTFLTGCLELRDKVGPITVHYNPKTNIYFNSIEVTELGKIMLEYLEPTQDTTVIDVGCNIGALSLMLAQKSDKVIGLSTMEHEIKTADEMKSQNNLHNVSFFACTPREIRTKLSSWVKKCISVAVVNLNTPFGKIKESLEVMTALRELPTIWRIAVYGSFSFDNRKCIEKLTSAANDSEFLPMRGCILDKSPSIQNSFDIVILFERKSLIEPKVELIASGPTVNVKFDSFSSESPFENQSIKQESNITRFPFSKPFLKGGRPSKKFGRFDSPMLPIDKDIKPKLPPPPKEILDFTVPPPPLPVSAEPLIESSVITKEDHRFHFSKSKERIHLPSVIDVLNVKELKRKFDSPSLPINPTKTNDSNIRNQDTNVNGYEQSANLVNRNLDEIQDSTLPNTNPTSLNCPPWHKPTEIQTYPQQVTPPQNSVGSGLLRVKQEHELKFSQTFEPQCQNNQHLENAAIKDESRLDLSPFSSEEDVDTPMQKHSIVKMPSPVEKEEGELSDSGDNSISLDAIIKPEPMDLDDDDDDDIGSDFSSITGSRVKEETIVNNTSSFPPTHIKSEPIDFNEFTIQPIKNEPSDISEDRESNKSTDSNRFSIKPDPESTILKQDSPDVASNSSSHQNFRGLRVKPELGSASFNTTIVKSEPIESDNQPLENVLENSSSAEATVKREPLSSLTEIEDIQNMETPIHNPAVLTRQYSPSPPPSASTFDGFEFSVKPNMSFLSFDKGPANQQHKIKQEKVELENDQNVRNQEEDNEIEIIAMKGEAKAPKFIKQERRNSIESKRSVNDMHVNDKQSDDLRVLLEKRQKLQAQLEGNLDFDKPKRRFDQSPSRGGSPSRSRRSPYSPSEWRPNARYSPDAARRRRDRSPESSKWGRKYRSPSFDRYRGKRYRSPISSDRKPYRTNRSPDSPDRFRRKKYYAPNSSNSPIYKKRIHSPDIFDRIYDNKNRSSESPGRSGSEKNRSSNSPDRSRYRKNRSPISPDRPWQKRNKSPISFDKQWKYRNRSPPLYIKNWDKKYKSRSPDRINSRSKSRSSSPSERRRRRSPLSRSPSPPAKYFKANKSPVDERSVKSPSPSASLSSKISHDDRSDSKKKKKKKKKSSRSKSPRRSESEKKNKKKKRRSRSTEKSIDFQLDGVSTEDSSANLGTSATVEQPNEIPVPTAVV